VHYPIYIPSKNRPEGKTFELLKDIDAKKYILVEPQDIEKYEHFKENFKLIILEKNDQGLYYVRDVTKKYAENTGTEWYWVIDDDISKFYRTENNKNKPITPKEALLSAQELFNSMPISLGALEYQQYAWSQKKLFKINSYADCVVCFNTKRTKKYNYDLQFKLKGDRDMALQIMADKQFVMRALQISFSCPKFGSNKGGLFNVYNKQKLEHEMSKLLMEKWGNRYVIIQKKKTNDGVRFDAKINWKAFNVKFK
tara:strand:+ start:3021 stop:3782 length:762 start_codon:yes stop_codon:yes gene_type:complete